MPFNKRKNRTLSTLFINPIYQKKKKRKAKRFFDPNIKIGRCIQQIKKEIFYFILSNPETDYKIELVKVK